VGRAITNIIVPADSATTTAPTDEWIEAHGMDELVLPLLSADKDFDEIPVRFILARPEQSPIDGDQSSESAQTPVFPIARENSTPPPLPADIRGPPAGLVQSPHGHLEDRLLESDNEELSSDEESTNNQ
jgi:hypothetical protein